MSRFPLTLFVPNFNCFSGTATKLLNNFFSSKLQIARGPDGKAKIQYKKWSTSSTWLPEESEGINFLKGLPRGALKV